MKTISLPSSATLASKFNFISKEEIKYQKKNNEYKTVNLVIILLRLFLGGKLEHIANGKTCDKYVFTFGKKGGVK